MSAATGGARDVVLPAAVLRALRPASSWLDSWALADALVAAALLVVVAAVVLPRQRRRRGRRHRRLRASLVVTGALVVVLACGSIANAVSGYVPTPEALRLIATGSTGRLSTVRIGAPALHVPASTTYVFLPARYALHPHRRYPVAYLVHGDPGESSDWFAAGDAERTVDVLVAHHLIPPMIVVAPDINGGGLHDSECLDSPTPSAPGGGAQIETYLRTVVVPYVDTHYRTLATPRDRILGGMSAGGYCALDQGLRHRGTYGGAILAMEPYGDPGHDWRAALGGARFARVSPTAYLPSIRLRRRVPVFLDIGSQASTYERDDVDRVQQQLQARREPVLRRTEPGLGHNWTMARTALPYGLVFAARYLPAERPDTSTGTARGARPRH